MFCHEEVCRAERLPSRSSNRLGVGNHEQMQNCLRRRSCARRGGGGSSGRSCSRRCDRGRGPGFGWVADPRGRARRVLTDNGSGNEVSVQQRAVHVETIVNRVDGVVITEQNGVLTKTGRDGVDDLGRGIGLRAGWDNARSVENLKFWSASDGSQFSRNHEIGLLSLPASSIIIVTVLSFTQTQDPCFWAVHFLSDTRARDL